jgi:hypothetical protein
MGQPESRSTHHKTRRDGWTAERQLGFFAALFAAAWDRAMEGHKLFNFTSRRRTADGPIFGGIPPKFMTR